VDLPINARCRATPGCAERPLAVDDLAYVVAHLDELVRAAADAAP
jgi:hypothetical protein